MVLLRIAATALDLPTPVEPDHREMLRQHVVGVEVGRNRRVLAEVADGDGARPAGGVDQVQLVAADHHHRIADRGVVAHAAAEAAASRGGALDLAEQVDAGHDAGAVDLLGPQRDLGDHPDQRGAVAFDRDELADGRPLRTFRQREREADARLGAFHREHVPQAVSRSARTEIRGKSMPVRHHDLHGARACRSSLAADPLPHGKYVTPCAAPPESGSPRCASADETKSSIWIPYAFHTGSIRRKSNNFMALMSFRPTRPSSVPFLSRYRRGDFAGDFALLRNRMVQARGFGSNLS